MMHSPVSSQAALYLGRRATDGGSPPLAWAAPAKGTAAAAPGSAPPAPQLPVLRKVVEAYPADMAHLVVLGDVDPGTVAYLRVLADALEVGALVATPRDDLPAGAAELGEVTLVTPDLARDVVRTAVEYTGRLSRRTSAPVVVQGPGSLLTEPDLGRLADHGARGVVWSVQCGDTGRSRGMLLSRLPVFTTAGDVLTPLVDAVAGRAIAQTLECRLRGDLVRSLMDCAVAMPGFDGRHRALADALRKLGAQVSVRDTDPVRTCAAVLAGYPVADTPDLVAGADVLVDLHGELLRDDAVLSLLRPETVILTDTLRPLEAADAVGRLVVTEWYGETAACLFRGKPLLVITGSAPGHVDRRIVGRLHDLLCCELYLSIRTLARGCHPPGVHRLSAESCAAIASLWYGVYGGTA